MEIFQYARSMEIFQGEENPSTRMYLDTVGILTVVSDP
jgi:hypothetical protein